MGNHVEPSFGSSIESPGEELVPHGGRKEGIEGKRVLRFVRGEVACGLAGFGRYLRRGG